MKNLQKILIHSKKTNKTFEENRVGKDFFLKKSKKKRIKNSSINLEQHYPYYINMRLSNFKKKAIKGGSFKKHKKSTSFFKTQKKPRIVSSSFNNENRALNMSLKKISLTSLINKKSKKRKGMFKNQ